ncbi:DUF4129 domain-containing protein [Mucilaginibacter sabulilitoris]|uniref:DUF4129 domain-containing protein n=1 Tax=Mucilaginibacter sabulilitoris TaxID=1173583 RepID=A0ABZ0TKZ0_9SPHI|nr:DUF4129 domain-containing protein [Mucilaginibacter sabulilitoris]WPU93489.1 DUF4129 domain-containing protein [Mucilaginibacter sabulilitoris]
MPKLLFTFFFSLIAGLLFSVHATAPVKKAPARLHVDSSEIVVKSFNIKALKAYHNDKNFNYNGAALGEASAWDRFWDYIWNKLFSKLGNSPLAGAIIKYTFLVIAIGLLVYFIFRLMGMDAIKLLQGEARKTSLTYTESLENIHELNFDSEIEKAISQHNYRLAVRLLYLRCLKQLSDNNLIHWQIDKTNSAYVHELNDASQRQAFSLLTRQFEYVWYGGFTIDGTAFQNINQLFQNFKKQLP